MVLVNTEGKRGRTDRSVSSPANGVLTEGIDEVLLGPTGLHQEVSQHQLDSLGVVGEEFLCPPASLGKDSLLGPLFNRDSHSEIRLGLCKSLRHCLGSLFGLVGSSWYLLYTTKVKAHCTPDGKKKLVGTVRGTPAYSGKGMGHAFREHSRAEFTFH